MKPRQTTTPAPAEGPEGEADAADTSESPVVETSVSPAGGLFAGGTQARILFDAKEDGSAEGGLSDAGVNHDTVVQFVEDALERTGHEGVAVYATNPMYQPGSARGFTSWDVKLALPEAEAREVLDSLQATINDQPIFPLSNKIGSRVAGNMTTAAIAAVVASLLGIVAYIWFRFQGVIYGLAAVVALGSRRRHHPGGHCPECLFGGWHGTPGQWPHGREIPA